MIAGVPVALLGVVFFVVAGALCLPAAWRSQAPAVRIARIGWMVAGVAMVLHLRLRRALPDRRHLPLVHRGARDHGASCSRPCWWPRRSPSRRWPTRPAG